MSNIYANIIKSIKNSWFCKLYILFLNAIVSLFMPNNKDILTFENGLTNEEILSQKLGFLWTSQNIKQLAENVIFISIQGWVAGDEGKGGIAYAIAEKYRKEGYYVVICSGSGSGNAGHTFYHNGHKYNTNTLPASFMHADILFMGAEKLFNIFSFKKEIERNTVANGDTPALTSIDHLKKIIVIDNTSKITYIPAILQEKINEYNKTKTTDGATGTTGQGVSTTIGQYATKFPVETLTALNAFNADKIDNGGNGDNKEIDKFLDTYYCISNTEAIVEQYLKLVNENKIKPFQNDNISLKDMTTQEAMNEIKKMDRENIIWFCDTFGDNIKPHDTFNEYVRMLTIKGILTLVLAEGVQANSLADANGPLVATTSSKLNPDILMLLAFKFCEYTSLAMAGVKVLSIGVSKLIQSTVGNHKNPAKIRDYAKLLKYKYTNDCDDDGRVAELLKNYPIFGKYAKLAILTLDKLNKNKSESDILGPEYLLVKNPDGTYTFDESVLLSRFLNEFGTTTNRVRDLSWYDLVRIFCCSFNQVNPAQALTRLDTYNMFKVFKICVGYNIDNKLYFYKKLSKIDEELVLTYNTNITEEQIKQQLIFSSYKDFTSNELDKATPIYIDFESWDGEFDLTTVKKYEDFPPQAIKFLDYIQTNGGKIVAINLSASNTLFI